MTQPNYVYVASSWRNPIQPAVCAALAASGIDHYDFRNPPGGAGFGWEQVRPADTPTGITLCQHCNKPITFGTVREVLGVIESPSTTAAAWRHVPTAARSCDIGGPEAAPRKGLDWVGVQTYKWMVEHPTAIAGYNADFRAMTMADTFVMILPCGKSAHLELGWAVGAGKRTAILLEDPVEPELMYRMVDHLASSLFDLLGWLGVED